MTQKFFKLRWLIIAVTMLAVVPKEARAVITPVEPSSGDGTESNPYQIASKENLYWFAALVNGTDGLSQNPAAWAVLTQDITVNTGVLNENGKPNSGNFEVWTPIGNHSDKYTGTFDGQGHTISGLYINEYVDFSGLFGNLGNGIIRNVGVKDSYIRGSQDVGGVCAYNYGGTIDNCYNTGTIVGEAQDVGGVCGYCYNNYSNGIIKNCYNTGSITGKSYYVGGVCGYFKNSTMENCYNTGNISGISYVGGVCGYGSAIKNCYNAGQVVSNERAGGIIADGSDTTNCYYLQGCTTSYFDYKATAKTAAQFASGEVAWLLNGNSDGATPEKTSPWLQDLGTDAYPVLKANTEKCIAVMKNGSDYKNPGAHSYDNNTFADSPDVGTINLHSQVCDHCKGATEDGNIKAIRGLNSAVDADIVITKNGESWTTDATIALKDDPTANWYHAPVEFATTGEASYSRTMSDNRWATVCLPYAISTTNEGCKFYELSGVDESKITLTELTGTDVAAGTPVFVMANDGVNEITFSVSDGATMVTAPVAGFAIGGYTLTGVFDLTKLSKDGGDMFIKSDKIWNMSQPGKDMSVKLFHAYLKSDGTGGSGAPQRSIAIDGGATVIDDVLDTLNATNAEYYDMSGRRTATLQKGVNIIKKGNTIRKVIIR